MLPSDAQILDRLRQKGSRILSFGQLSGTFGVPESEADAFRELLNALEAQGKITRVRGEKYSAIEFSNLVAGKITIRAEGFGFVLSPDPGGEDLYVPRSGLGGALDGDFVLAR